MTIYETKGQLTREGLRRSALRNRLNAILCRPLGHDEVLSFRRLEGEYSQWVTEAYACSRCCRIVSIVEGLRVGWGGPT